jgi:NADPH:quinone reductase-like Zn-dependent oxidoreductase
MIEHSISEDTGLGFLTHCPLSPLLSLEVSGYIEAIGANVTEWEVGDTSLVIFKTFSLSRFETLIA